MVAFTSQISILLLLFLYATTFNQSMSSNHRVVRCNEKDRGTLLLFKQGVIDPSNRLSTWSSEEDCCAWKGVRCDNITGRVTRLDLHWHMFSDSGYLEGEINLSILELEFLNYLDLSKNNFTAVSIPLIRDNITLATSLHYLDLSYNDQLHMDNLNWLSQLSSLKYLNLSFIDLHKETNWLQLVAMLPSLSELRLSDCGLTNISPSLKYVNFTSLVTLDLSLNNFDPELPHWLFNLSSDFSHLQFRGNNLHGEIPTSLLNLRNLKFLDLSSNQLKGSIPNWLGQPEHLQHLDLSNNLFHGSIPSTLANLSSLIEFDISSNLLRGNLPESLLGQLSNLNSLRVGKNSLSGVLSEMNFSKLSNLKALDLSSSAFEFDIDTNWIPSFQLSYIDLSNTIQGPNFPAWLYTQRSLETLHISGSGVSSIDWDMFPSFVAGIDRCLDLSYNSISGDMSNIMLNSSIIYLDHNNFTGRLPHISANAVFVDVSHNSFSGGFPDYWENWKGLIRLNMASNKLAGEVPLDLSNLKILQVIDLGKNYFSGNIPIKMPPSLELMILRSNQFAGNIPTHLCSLPSLRILDLAHNKLSGSIPQCVHKITEMVLGNDSSYWVEELNFDLVVKRLELEYKSDGQILSGIIDLSVNNLSGEIPTELFRLVKVRSLNLSHNRLTGKIPNMIGDMKDLESLDLSYNQLAGEIPQNISGLSFLSSLNLSYNNFSGQIPIGSQLQTFDAWSYIGNPELYGAPLTKNFTNEEENLYKAKQHAGDKDGDFETESLYLGMGLGVGFAVGFWGVCGSLYLNRAWRDAYFRFLNHVADRLYGIVTLKFSSFGGSGASFS